MEEDSNWEQRVTETLHELQQQQIANWLLLAGALAEAPRARLIAKAFAAGLEAQHQESLTPMIQTLQSVLEKSELLQSQIAQGRDAVATAQDLLDRLRSPPR